MFRLEPLIGITAALLLVSAPVAAQERSRCAECHIVRPDAPALDHVEDWDRSAHGAGNVGCDSCHGGNGRTVESMLAHRGIRPSGDRRSPVHRANLPATCGTCHAGPFAAFQDSRHYALLQGRRADGPTCSTCHDAVAGRLLSAAALERQCSACHGPGEPAARAGRAQEARRAYEALALVREQLKLARAMIGRVEDRQRRADLAAAYDQARVPLTRAINAGHRFVYDEMRTSLGTAQARTEALMQRIANPAN